MIAGASILFMLVVITAYFVASVSREQHAKYAFIFEKYRPGCSQWWEVPEALKKLSAVVATVFLSDSGLNQASAMALIVLLSIWAQIQFNPGNL